MSGEVISVVKRAMGFLLCVCLAGLFVLLMTWLILELRVETPSAQGFVFGSVYTTTAGLSMDGQSDSWETKARVDKAWRDEYLQNEMSLKSEFDSYGGDQAQQAMDATDSRSYASEK